MASVTFDLAVQPLRQLNYFLHRELPHGDLRVLVKNPDEMEFRQIFLRYAELKQIGIGPNLLEEFLETHYRTKGKPKRRCHPRDVITHAIDLIQFEQRPMELTKDILDRAFHSCFFEHDEGETM